MTFNLITFVRPFCHIRCNIFTNLSQIVDSFLMLTKSCYPTLPPFTRPLDFPQQSSRLALQGAVECQSPKTFSPKLSLSLFHQEAIWDTEKENKLAKMMQTQIYRLPGPCLGQCGVVLPHSTKLEVTQRGPQPLNKSSLVGKFSRQKCNVKQPGSICTARTK